MSAGTGTTVDLQGAANEFTGGPNGDITIENTGSGSANATQVTTSNSQVTVKDGAAVRTQGDSNQLTMGANAQATVLGNANTVTAAGPGDSVTVGGNGQSASDANDNHVNFAGGPGTLTVTDNARADAAGNGVTTTIGNDVTVGLSGSADTVTVTGQNSQVWTGGNGQNALDANDDHVNFSAGQAGSVTALDNSRVDVYGQGISFTAGNQDNVGMNGGGNTVNVVGQATNVWAGGNGQNADDSDKVRVNFADGANGSANLIDNSRVDVSGSNLTVNAGNSDSCGVTGSNDTANVSGQGTGIWIGGNGENASSADDDHVNFLNGQGGSITEFDNSRVDAVGSGLSFNAGNSDVFGLSGSANTANVYGTNSVAWVGGNGQSASGADDDHVNFAQGGEVVETDNARVDASGDHVWFSAGSNDTLGLTGAFDTVAASGPGDSIWIGNNGRDSSRADYVDFTGSSGGWVNEVDNSNLQVSGGNANVDILGSGNILTLEGGGGYSANGWGDTINTWGGTGFNLSGGNDTIALGGTGDYLGLLGGSGYSVGGSWDTVATWAGTDFSLFGSHDQMNLAPYDIVGVDGQYDSASGNGTDNTVYFGNTSGDVSYGFDAYDDYGAGDTYADPFGPSGEDEFDPYSGDFLDDPLILNLQGGKVQTVPLANSPAYFDMQNNGRAVSTGWATGGEGMLVYDPTDSLHSAAQVTRTNQLVGGFDALDKLALQSGDTTGTLTPQDALWKQIKVLVQPAGDSNPKDAQLETLDQLKIGAIDLHAVAGLQDNDGNTQLDSGSFTWTDGTVGQAASVALHYNLALSAGGSSTSQLVQSMAGFTGGAGEGMGTPWEPSEASALPAATTLAASHQTLAQAHA